MNSMSEHDMRTHVTVLGWLNIVGSALMLLVGAFVFVLLAGIGVAVQDVEATPILSIVGTSVGLFLALISLPGILAGAGLLARKAWGRYLAIVVGILNLINIPIGTLLGIYTLWVLFQPNAGEYFTSAAGTAVQHA